VTAMKNALFFVHPNGKSRTIKPGFCWLGFCLPLVWAVSEGLWRPFAFALLGHVLLARAGDLARHFETPSMILAALSYFVVMIVFGRYGKGWLMSDMLAHGYRQVGPVDASL
jgi:hypothetical protein